MTVGLKKLMKYSRVDKEKKQMIDSVLEPPVIFESAKRYQRKAEHDLEQMFEGDYCGEGRILKKKSVAVKLEPSAKFCPKCGRKYPESENVCFDCLVHLKNFSDNVNVRDIESKPFMSFEGTNEYRSFDELLCDENLSKVMDFDFTSKEFNRISRKITLYAFRNFDSLIKENEINFDSLAILDKIILIAKSFTDVEFKSYGFQLGYFEKNTVYLDDRQTDSLQITTVIHELSHFLLKQILILVLCRLLDATYNEVMDSLVTYILNSSYFAELIDEYAAHNVEGRFTLFGYQDYSSFDQIEFKLKDEIDDDEVEITKSIGNNFSVEIKKILESLIDWDLRKDIKEQFMKDVLDKPNYEALMRENCRLLTQDSFLKAIGLILYEGFQTASLDIDRLDSY